jgi:hypothetical protein
MTKFSIYLLLLVFIALGLVAVVFGQVCKARGGTPYINFIGVHNPILTCTIVPSEDDAEPFGFDRLAPEEQ